MFQDSLNKSEGYSFVEVLVSILIFGIVSLSLCVPLTRSISLTANDQDIVNANNLARLYMKDTEISWQIQTNYDEGVLPDTSGYNNNGQYNVNVSALTMATDLNSNTTVRRVNIVYRNETGKVLLDLFSDFNRPGASLN